MKVEKYRGVEYVAQEITTALNRLIKEKSGGDLTVSHTHNPDNQTSTISYSIAGITTELTVYKDGRKLHLTQTNQGKGLESKTEKEIKPKRSKEGRISQTWTTQFAKSSFQNLKDFYKKLNSE